MDREIKFRYYDEMIKEMVSVLEIKWENGKPSSIKLQNGNLVYFMNGDGYKKIQQFTGLKDKNGKEIYEGDIVKNFDYRACEVLFQNGAYGYETEHVGFVSFAENESFNWKNNQSKYLEVVSNIHDNPSLLGTNNAD